jgi:hypothetical protein
MKIEGVLEQELRRIFGPKREGVTEELRHCIMRSFLIGTLQQTLLD